ncbi:MAG: hypothetical protein H6624_13810 [Bdellovibrionaceae bacterium]|nr:hypothetical protein [Bdellovibrionales bacterium]MCB9085416.1 hypothetical protein [Pseudobdellovibrionaceae bacterium]
MSQKRDFSKTATLIWVAVFLSALPFEISKATSIDSVTAGKIQQAQRLTISGQRRQGQLILIEALSDKQTSSEERPKLVEGINQISRNFLTDRAQAAFESGESLFFSGNRAESLKRYREALELEPENTQIIAALGRNLLAENNCGEARGQAEEGLSINPYDSELLILKARLDLCRDLSAQGRSQWEEEVKALEAEFSFEVSWYRLILEENQGIKKSIPTLARKLLKEDPQFPEPLYLLWKHSPQSPARRNWAASYITTCKKSDQMFLRRYKNEPRVCSWVKVLEEALAKGSGS